MLAELCIQCPQRFVHKERLRITNNRTALTRTLAKEIHRHVARRSNPNDIADEMCEYKSEMLSTLQLQVVCLQIWGKERKPGEQLTLDRLSMHDAEIPTAKSLGVCAPGHALIRHFFLDVQEARDNYQLSWRQQNVVARVGSVDATFKRGKALSDLCVRQTVTLRPNNPSSNRSPHKTPKPLPQPPTLKLRTLHHLSTNRITIYITHSVL